MKVSAVVPSVIASSVVSIHCVFPFVVHSETKTAIPAVTSALASASVALDRDQDAHTYMPFCEPVDWFLTKTRSLATTLTPSIVCSPESVMFAVVATRTDAFQSVPFTSPSTYHFVAASVEADGVPRLVIFWEFIETSAVGAANWSSLNAVTHDCDATIFTPALSWYFTTLLVELYQNCAVAGLPGSDESVCSTAFCSWLRERSIEFKNNCAAMIIIEKNKAL